MSQVLQLKFIDICNILYCFDKDNVYSYFFLAITMNLLKSNSSLLFGGLLNSFIISKPTSLSNFLNSSAEMIFKNIFHLASMVR